MKAVEYDVFLCWREPSGSELAKLVSASLARRGFVVFCEERPAGSGPDERRLELIDETPDFSLLLTPGALNPCADPEDPMRAEIARAFGTGANVVPVSAPGFALPDPVELPSDLSPLARRTGITYDPSRSGESVARIAHMLSSEATVEERRLMRGAKRVLLAISLAFVAVAAMELARALPRMLARRADVRPLPPLTLYWSGFGQRLDNNRWVEIPLSDGSRVAGGDRIRLVFSPSADSFAYGVVKDLRGDVSVVFPPVALDANSRVRAGALYEAPADAGWLTVDREAGLKAIYILASYDPLENLEELVEESFWNPNLLAGPSLVASTVDGLFDGRHSALGRRVRTRSGRPIVQGLEIPAGPATSSATLASGEVVEHRLMAQPGLLSAAVEIRVRYEPTR